MIDAIIGTIMLLLSNYLTYNILNERRKKDLQSLWKWQSYIERRLSEERK